MKLPRLLVLSLLLFAAVILPRGGFAFDPATLPQIGYHPGGIAYWDTPQFANAMYNGGAWIEFAQYQWGNSISSWDNPQFDGNGFPKYLNEGLMLRAICFALHSDPGNTRPSTWPRRSRLAEGHVVLTWEGNADIRLNSGGTYRQDESSGAETGTLQDGRRVYVYTGGGYVQWLEIHAIDPGEPVTDIKVWLADPADPMNTSLEGQLYHPTFLARIGDADWGTIRFMDFEETNANPQQNWSDRRPPTHAFMTGELNPRAPADGASGNRGSGAAYEHMVALCNTTQKDMWINVPHLATDDFVRNLANLIRYGSDGVNPYDHTVADPVHAPLDANRRVYIEYSNEIWSSGYSFPQGNWADAQAAALGISKAQFNARRFCDVWRLFQEQFGGTDRLVRVAAVFTAADWYTTPFLQEMHVYGPTLAPPVEPDVIAATTYFGNGIQDWVYDRALAQVGTGDPWFFTGDTFDAGGGLMRPVSLAADDPYWTGEAFPRHQAEAFAEWKRRMLSGDAREGAGPDAVGIGGGFGEWLHELAQTTFDTPKPIVAYEGGPSLYTDNRDGGDSRDDGLTIFMEAMNRNPMIADVYTIHLNQAKSHGLWAHMAFTDCGPWGKYGQWGHLEYLDQPISEAPKYQFLLDWIAGSQGIRHIDSPANARPGFATAGALPVGVVGQAYDNVVAAEGGDGALRVDVVGSQLVAGLSLAPVVGSPAQMRISGTPQEYGLSYAALRVLDADGDPAWRTFAVKSVGGPGTLVECDFSGTNPARALPWNKSYVVANGLVYTGWSAGAGIVAADGDDAIVWSVNAPAEQESLEQAIADDEYLSLSFSAPAGAALDLRGAEVRFTIRRIDWHSPRQYAVRTSVGGFTAADVLFDSSYSQETMDTESRFSLPETADYGAIQGPFEIRLYGHEAQYGGHRTSLAAFRMEGSITGNHGADRWHVK